MLEHRDENPFAMGGSDDSPLGSLLADLLQQWEAEETSTSSIAALASAVPTDKGARSFVIPAEAASTEVDAVSEIEPVMVAAKPAAATAENTPPSKSVPPPSKTFSASETQPGREEPPPAHSESRPDIRHDFHQASPPPPRLTPGPPPVTGSLPQPGRPGASSTFGPPSPAAVRTSSPLPPFSLTPPAEPRPSAPPQPPTPPSAFRLSSHESSSISSKSPFAPPSTAAPSSSSLPPHAPAFPDTAAEPKPKPRPTLHISVVAPPATPSRPAEPASTTPPRTAFEPPKSASSIASAPPEPAQSLADIGQKDSPTSPGVPPPHHGDRQPAAHEKAAESQRTAPRETRNLVAFSLFASHRPEAPPETQQPPATGHTEPFNDRDLSLIAPVQAAAASQPKADDEVSLRPSDFDLFVRTPHDEDTPEAEFEPQGNESGFITRDSEFLSEPEVETEPAVQTVPEVLAAADEPLATPPAEELFEALEAPIAVSTSSPGETIQEFETTAEEEAFDVEFELRPTDLATLIEQDEESRELEESIVTQPPPEAIVSAAPAEEDTNLLESGVFSEEPSFEILDSPRDQAPALEIESAGNAAEEVSEAAPEAESGAELQALADLMEMELAASGSEEPSQEPPLGANDVPPSEEVVRRMYAAAVEGGETELRRYVVFRIGTNQFALPIESIVETERLPVVTPVPGLPDYVRGIFNLRGEILTLIDLRQVVGIQPDAAEEGNMLVVRTTRAPEPAAFVVDSVPGLAALRTADLSAVPSLFDEQLRPLVVGIGEYKEKIVSVLDPDRIFLHTELQELTV